MKNIIINDVEYTPVQKKPKKKKFFRWNEQKAIVWIFILSMIIMMFAKMTGQ